jgi:two-component system, sensor histidine kinase
MELRVLVWAPPRDAQLTCALLENSGFDCQTCATWSDLGRDVYQGAGVVMVAGEFLTSHSMASLEEMLSAQPPWSDLPLVIVTGSETSPEMRAALPNLGHVSLLPRPVAPDTLRSTVGAALRARRRQYQIRDLLRQRDEAQRRKDEFLAMLAHELRNPLAPLRTGLQLLHARPSPDVVQRTYAMMERQVGNLARLVDDLLDVSRITRRKITLKRRLLDVREVVQQAVEACRELAVQKALHLDLVLPDTSLVVDGDPVRLEQMIGNLLGNAIKYTPAGGSLHVAARAEDDSAVIVVRDSGVGIAPDHLPHVFDLFAQATGTLDRTQGGLGIGLTVVKLLTELHGGSVSIHSEGEGRGAEAGIRLPLSAGTGLESTSSRAGLSQGRAGRRVVIIEDNVDSADMLATYLKVAGHDVLVAHDGPAGLDAVSRHHPDVIICDIGLPKLDGYAVARCLRRSSATDQSLLIAVTGYGDSADRARTRAAGFAYHLTKPADPARVAALVATYQPASGRRRHAQSSDPD